MTPPTLVGVSVLAKTHGQTHASHDYKKSTASSEKPDCKPIAKEQLGSLTYASPTKP